MAISEHTGNGSADLKFGVRSTTYPEGLVHVEVVPPSAPTDSPSGTHLIFVLDVSYSMTTEAELTNATGDKERHGFSILNLVQHAALTTIRSLNESHRVSIVTFSDIAKRKIQYTKMDETGQDSAEASVRSLGAEGSTDLWAGLREALDIAQEEDSCETQRTEILLFTDGIPNREPTGGHIPALESYLAAHPSLSCTIRTFGFGFNLMSDLLVQIAEKGPSPGTFSFIPDPSLLGTVFIHAVADILATCSLERAKIRIECAEETELVLASESQGIPNDPATDIAALEYSCALTSSGAMEIDVGSVAYGQIRSFTFRTPRNEGSDVSNLVTSLHCARLESNAGVKSTSAEQLAKAVSISPVALAEDVTPEAALDATEYLVADCRLELCSVLRRAMDAMNGTRSTSLARVIIAEFERKLTPLASQHPALQAFLEDVQGQVTEALSRRDWYERWGVHYLRSLYDAHLHQKRNNFKDPGVQAYGGAYFESLLDHVNDVFDRINPPEPTVTNRSSCSAQSRSAAPASMACYNSYQNVCFAAGSTVLMAGEEMAKPVEDIVVGDLLQSPEGIESRVLCVVKTQCWQGCATLVQLPNGGPLITPWHPVKVNREWAFPAELAPEETRLCDAVYNFVLDHGHQIVVNGVHTVTLAHNLQGAKVKHAYFGTSAVHDDLRAMVGYNRGLVVLRGPLCLVRDTTTGLVIGLRQDGVKGTQLHACAQDMSSEAQQQPSTLTVLA